MQTLSRRSALQVFGIASITALLPAQATVTRKVVVAKPGENRFPYSVSDPTMVPQCMVTKEDSIGACSIFELVTRPREGPPRHIHHREDEWYYVLSGEFLFDVGNVKYSLPVGGSIWAPRGIPHVWASTSKSDARMILLCQPGGFENFFDDSAKGMMDKASPAQMEQIMNKYGIELLGPPMFAPAP